MERVTGIEPVSQAWKASALPLSYTRLGPRLAARTSAGKPATHALNSGWLAGHSSQRGAGWWTGLDSNQRTGIPGRFTVCCL